jgi:hypothetical protein
MVLQDAPQPEHGPAAFEPLGRHVQEVPQVSRIHGLRQVVEGALLDRFLGGLDRALSSEHEEFDIHVLRPQLLEKLDPVGAGHHQVGHHELGIEFLGGSQRLFGVVGGPGTEAPGLEVLTQAVRARRVVIHHQHAPFAGRDDGVSSSSAPRRRCRDLSPRSHRARRESFGVAPGRGGTGVGGRRRAGGGPEQRSA